MADLRDVADDGAQSGADGKGAATAGDAGVAGGAAASPGVALAVAGILAVLVLVVVPAAPTAVRILVGAIAMICLAGLAWRRSRGGVAAGSGGEARVLAERLVERNRELGQSLADLQSDHAKLEHYFDTLMENVPAHIYFKDERSRFLRTNRKMAAVFGCSHPADMVGKTDHDFFDAQHADDALEDERRVMRTGQSISGKIEQETFKAGDRERGWVLTNKMPFRDRNGRIVGTFGISSDVSDLVQARRELERERNMLRRLIDSFPDSIFVRDPGRHYLVVNRAMAGFVGADSPAEMIGRKPEDFFREMAEGGPEEDLEVLASGKAVVNREWSHPNAAGEVRQLMTTKVPLLDREGRCWGIVGMDRDVTEQRQAREQLRESERRLQEMMDNSPAVIWMKDLDGSYLMVNDGFESLFGLERRDVLGRTDHDILADKEAAARFREHDLEVISGGRARQVDDRLYVDGEPRWFVTVRFPLRDVSGRIHAIAGISTDITDRKHDEESLRRLNEDLVKANENLQRAQEQLIQAEKMESIGRLASGVAHEVKNPLAMIAMGLEILARRIPEEDDKATETIERMKRGIERAKKIVKGLVDFSSARQLGLQAGDVNGVVREALALTEYQLRKAKVEVVEDLAAELPPVDIDTNKLEQVLVNLVINAMHAMPDGGRLTLRTTEDRLEAVDRDEGARTKGHLREGDRVVRIEVEDEGTGIDPAHLKKLFDPFFTTKPTGVGTGLGLAVCRKIVELHRGTLELVNRAEGGVRATVTLKAAEP